MARDIMMKQAAEALLRLADMLEVEGNEGAEAPAPVAVVSFKCSGCGHAVPLTEINDKNQEAAGDAHVDPITAEDRVRCPECDGGILAAVTEEETPVEASVEAATEDGDTKEDDVAADEVAQEGADSDKTLEEGSTEAAPEHVEETTGVKKEEPKGDEKEASEPNLSVWASLISNASDHLGL